jgi:hypothetical protein
VRFPGDARAKDVPRNWFAPPIIAVLCALNSRVSPPPHRTRYRMQW